MSITLDELLRAGYQPGQILECPRRVNDACPCQSQGPQRDCGLAGSGDEGQKP